MKKNILTMIAVLVIAINSASAQVAWGARIGVLNFTETIKFSGLSISGSAPGFELGPVLYYSLKNNLYINSGAMLGVMIPKNSSNEDIGRSNYQNYYIGIPLYLGINIPLNNNNLSFFVQAGPSIGYWLSSDSGTNDLTNHVQADLGLMAGINIKKFKIELGYQYGLTNLTSVKGGGDYNGYETIASTSKLTSLFLGVSYVF